MKKTLLVAALAMGFTGAAQAADSVTLYGLIDAGIGYENVKAPGYSHSKIGATQGVSGGSRFGLRGSEDLGDGLKAIFTLESGFNNENGKSAQGGRLFGRQATVGLASDSWGTLEFGRQKNFASKLMETAIDPFGTNFDLASAGAAFGSAQSVRYDNMIAYQTPNFDGFRLGVGYSFNGDDTAGSNFATNENNRAITVGGSYINGPLAVIATYDRVNFATNSGDRDAKLQSYILGAAYDFEVVKVSAAWGQTFDGWYAGAKLGGNFDTQPAGVASMPGLYKAAEGFRADSMMLGATVPFGASKVMASWQRVDPKNDKLFGNGADKTTNIFALGYTYDLSKRTNLYAYASYAKNFAFTEDVKDTAVAVGVRHRF